MAKLNLAECKGRGKRFLILTTDLPALVRKTFTDFADEQTQRNGPEKNRTFVRKDFGFEIGESGSKGPWPSSQEACHHA